jgi:hypothetical protein
MLGANAAFWIAVGVATALGLVDFGVPSDGARVIGALAAANGILLALAAWRALRGSRLVDLAILVLVVVNGVLGVTDEVGLADWVAAGWNAVIVALLLVGMWRQPDRGGRPETTGEREG